MVSDPGQSRRVVSSWKGIAGHFGVTIRTAQNWEAERGLPVYRMPGVKGRVYAYADELDNWASGNGSEAEAAVPAGLGEETRAVGSRRRWIVWVAAAALLLAVAAIANWLSRPDLSPSSFSVSGRTLVVRNAVGERIWSHDFDEEFIFANDGKAAWRPYPELKPWIGDLDGDGKREVLFARSVDPATGKSSELYCFDSGGRIRWRFTPGRTVETRKEKFPAPYFLRSITVMEGREGRPPLVLAVGTHGFNYPSYIAAISPRGEVLREYWHSGHIHTVTLADLDSDGRSELYLHGNHNPTRSTSLIALDPYDFGGTSRETDPDYQLLDLGAPRELGRVLLPSSELTRRLQEMSIPDGFNLQTGRLVVCSAQTSTRDDVAIQPGVYHTFGPGMELLDTEYAWNFQGVYEHLVRTGRIKPYDPKADLERMRQVLVVTPWRGGPPASQGEIHFRRQR